MNQHPRPLAVVTGGSSGIGYELAKQFAQNGFDLVIVSDTRQIQDAGRSLREFGARVETLVADLSSFEGVEELLDLIEAQPQPVEALAVNAGVGTYGEFVRDTDLQDELYAINLNVTGAVHLTKRVARDMVARGRGRILFTSSIVAVIPASLMAVYGATKAFLFSFSEALRNELKDTGVSVTALMPGPTDTDFFRKAHMEKARVAQGSKDDPAEVAKQGFEALMAGKDHILASSIKTKIQGALADLMPETAKAEMHRRMAEPASKAR